MTNFEYYRTKEAAEKAYNEYASGFDTPIIPSMIDWLYEEYKKPSEKSIETRLNDLREYLVYKIGIGDVYGVLGHETAPCVRSLDDVKNVITEIRNIGRKNEFVYLIDTLIEKAKYGKIL